MKRTLIITAVCAIWMLTGLGIHSGLCQDKPVNSAMPWLQSILTTSGR